MMSPELPCPRNYPEAASVARYHAHKTTRDRYEDCAKQLVLPEGADSITVWVGFTSKRKGDAVAINNVKLEDLGR
jgi:hypothetical protein